MCLPCGCRPRVHIKAPASPRHPASRDARGALHPIVNGLLRPGAARAQVERERYEHPSGAFELVLGAQINPFADRPVPTAVPLLDRLLEALRKEPLVHGIRLFIAYHDGWLRTNEVLVDGEQWPGGEAVVASHSAPLPDGRVAIWIFGLLVPGDQRVAF